MTDLSRFDNHTPGPWDVFAVDGYVGPFIILNQEEEDRDHWIIASPRAARTGQGVGGRARQGGASPQVMRDSVDGEDVFDMAQIILEKEWL